MSVREQSESDLGLFFNVDEFGEVHRVEDREVTVVLDEEVLKEQNPAFDLGQVDLVLYARVADLPPRKGPGSSLMIDGCEYLVVEWRESVGLATVQLAQNQES